MGGVTWANQTASALNSWRSVAFGNGHFIAVATSGIGNRTMTSTDGITWNTVDTTTNNNWEAVAFGNNTFVAVSTSGVDDRIMTLGLSETSVLELVENDPDVIGQWSTQASAEDNTWNDIVFGNGLYVAVAGDGTNRVMTSLDGVTWTNRTAAEANNWRGVTFGAGQFIAVASSGTNQVMTSTDGVTWVPRSITSSDWRSVTFGNGTYVAISRTSLPDVATSPDGITWTDRTSVGLLGWREVIFVSELSLFVAVAGASSDQIMTSPDGITWTQRTTPDNLEYRSLAFGNGILVAVASDGTNNQVMTSPDAITWTQRVTPVDQAWLHVAFGNGSFVAVSTSGTGNRCMISTDGISWSILSTAADNNWESITFGNDQFVAVATSGTGNRAMILPMLGSATAILDLQSNSSGVLPPRMPTIRRNLIPSPVAGLGLFNTTNTHNEVYDGTAFRALSQIAVNTFEIYQESDWLKNPNNTIAGGIVTVDDGRYVIKDGYVFTNTYDFVVGAQAIIEGETLSPLIYVGTGTWFTGMPEILGILSTIGVLAAPGSQLFDLTGANPLTSIIIVERQTQFVAVGGTNTIGTVRGFRVPTVIATIFSGFQEGVTFIDGSMVLDSTNFAMNLTGTSPIVNLSGDFLIGASRFCDYRGSASQPIFNIDPAIDVPVSLLNNRNIFDTEFFASGVTGTFTVVADASVPAEAITSVTDSSGVARFNFTAPPTLFVDQEVVISTFVTNTDYNGTFIITATGANFFEVASIAFGTDETGSFLSNSVTLTDTTTTLSDGDTLLVDTDQSTDYDGGATVYNQLTNTFQINRTFAATETGTWDTGSLTEKAVVMTVRDNPGQADSRAIGSLVVNGNTTVTTISTQNAWVDIDFGGNVVESSNIERWKLIDADNASAVDTGLEPYSGIIAGHFSVLSPGSQNYELRYLIDTGSGFVVLPDAIEIPFGTDSATGTFPINIPLVSNEGDIIKPQIRNIDGLDNMTITHLSAGPANQ